MVDVTEELSDYCKGIPLSALRKTSIMQLSNYLDQEDETFIGDCCNDWCGLAEKVGYLNRDIRTFKQTGSPTTALLDNWATRKESSNTIDTLIKYLKEIQRTDVIIESDKMIRTDVDQYKKRVPVPQPPTLQVDDERERFDAFVVYGDSRNDILFVKEMVEILEGKEYIKLFVPGRDDLAGTERYVLTADMIANRCRRVIVVLSKGFENSEYCDFALKLAQSLSPGAKTKRIVPIVIDNVDVPLILNFVTDAKYTNSQQREWFWDRVAATIKCPLIPNIEDWQCTIDDLKNMRYHTKAVAHMFSGLAIACQEFKDEGELEKKTKKKG